MCVSEYVDSDEEDSEDDDDEDDGTTWEDLEREAAASDRMKRSMSLPIYVLVVFTDIALVLICV